MDRITHTQKIGHSLAIAFRAPPKGCIHHTDRGSQYYSHDDQNILPRHGFKVSPSHPCGYALLGQWMSGKGNCSDNAAVETFFKTINAELIWWHSWKTRRQAEMAIFDYIRQYYNPHRQHPPLGYKPCRLRTKGGLNEHLGRHECATGPSAKQSVERDLLCFFEQAKFDHLVDWNLPLTARFTALNLDLFGARAGSPATFREGFCLLQPPASSSTHQWF
jgi:hypothetical protein